jgi:hypothetical protein
MLMEVYELITTTENRKLEFTFSMTCLVIYFVLSAFLGCCDIVRFSDSEQDIE